MIAPSVTSELHPAGLRMLVSGVGFAGLATAFWLARAGHRVTVVEIAAGLRRGGTPVDIEGEAIDSLARMGLLDAVRAKALPPRRFEFRDHDDVVLATMGGEADDAAPPRFEIHRDDLLDILFGAVADHVDLMFGRSITRLEQSADSVAVTLDDGSRLMAALVFGCDGNRSRTRRLALDATDAALAATLPSRWPRSRTCCPRTPRRSAVRPASPRC